MTQPRIRIESNVVGHDSRVFYVNPDYHPDDWFALPEIELSGCVTGVELAVKVGEVNRARLDVLLVGATVDAGLERLVLHHVAPSRFGRWLWRLKKWWWRVKYVDATRFRDEWKVVVR